MTSLALNKAFAKHFNSLDLHHDKKIKTDLPTNNYLKDIFIRDIFKLQNLRAADGENSMQENYNVV